MARQRVAQTRAIAPNAGSRVARHPLVDPLGQSVARRLRLRHVERHLVHRRPPAAGADDAHRERAREAGDAEEALGIRERRRRLRRDVAPLVGDASLGGAQLHERDVAQVEEAAEELEQLAARPEAELLDRRARHRPVGGVVERADAEGLDAAVAAFAFDVPRRGGRGAGGGRASPARQLRRERGGRGRSRRLGGCSRAAWSRRARAPGRR